MLLGYEWNDGGINNQKLALLGLAIEAARHKSDIYLPRIFNKDVGEKNSSVIEFDKIFWAEIFEKFAERWEINIVAAPCDIEYANRIERCGWRFFDIGAGHIASLRLEGLNPCDIAADFFRSLQPKVTNSKIFSRISSSIFRDHNINTVVQIRYEQDWLEHSKYNLQPVFGDKEDFCIPPDQILKKVEATFLDKPGMAYVSCDENYMPFPKEYFKETIFNASRIKTLWKSDLVTSDEARNMLPLEASIIDFELARISERFVGLSRSTFGNLVAFEKFSNAYRVSNSDFIYNLPVTMLGQRTDSGTTDDPFLACGIKK